MREHFAVYLWKPTDMGFIALCRTGPALFFFFFFLFFLFVRRMNNGGEKMAEERTVDTCRGMTTELKACPTRYREDATGRFRRA